MTRRLAILLLALLPLGACAQQPSTPVEGTDYIVIPDGQPWQPLDGKVEVVEVFAYNCHHCADFQAYVDEWKRKLPADVRFSYVPAAYDPRNTYARAYFAAEQLGVLDATHVPLFEAIHDAQSVPVSNASVEELAVFYANHGVDAAKFKAAMASPEVDASVQHAREFMLASGLRGTPTLIVDGKYRVQGDSHADTLRIADQLVAMERAARGQR